MMQALQIDEPKEQSDQLGHEEGAGPGSQLCTRGLTCVRVRGYAGSGEAPGK